MLLKTGLFVFLLTALQVSAQYKAVFTINEIDPESTSSSRIVSGWEARRGEIPHHVSLHTVSTLGVPWRCGGAIIARMWIITAAQCTINMRGIYVRFGVSFYKPDFTIDTTQWYIHPDFNVHSTAAQPNDIALLKLHQPLYYNDFVQPIRIQSSADAYRDYDGEQVYISGHGRTWTDGSFSDELRWVYLRAISNSECVKTYSESLVVNTTICARYFSDPTRSPCQGDGGAPLVHVGFDGVPTLIGIHSFMRPGIDSCHGGHSHGYVRPGPYLAWIKEITGIDFEEENSTTTTTTSTPSPDITTSPNSTTLTTPTTTTTIASDLSTSPTPTPTTSTTELITTTTTDSADQEPEYSTPDDTITSPDGSGDGDDSDSSESGQDDDIAQLLKRLQVIVKVKVRMDKYNTTKAVGMEVGHEH